MFVARFVAAAFGMVAEHATLSSCATKGWCVISLTVRGVKVSRPVSVSRRLEANFDGLGVGLEGSGLVNIHANSVSRLWSFC